jgi:hypothetical protein
VVGLSGLDRWLGDIVHLTVVVCNWGCVYGWPLPTGWWWLRLLSYCASNTLFEWGGRFMWPFAVTGLGLR